MKRLLLAGVLAVAALGAGVPASAQPLGSCEGDFDYLCSVLRCDAEGTCGHALCLVWLNGHCIVV